MPLGMEAGLGPGDTVLDGDPAPRKGHSNVTNWLWNSSAHFLAHVYCGQMAGCIKVACGMEVGLGQTTFC